MLQQIFEVLDDYVERNGFGKFLAGFLTVLSLAGVGGTIFGALWLRVTVAFLLGLLVVMLMGLLILERRRLLRKIRQDAAVMTRYAKAAALQSTFSVRNWSQDVTVDKKGDVVIRRVVTLTAAPTDEPHHLTVNAVYYGSATITSAAKRKIKVAALRRGPDQSAAEVRTHYNVIWGVTANNLPKLDVLVHLDGGVAEGEQVIVEWTWPGYSKDLRHGDAGEDFDVLFRVDVVAYEYKIRIRDVKRNRPPAISSKGGVVYETDWDGNDYVVKFGGIPPAQGTAVGVRLDMPQK